MGTRILLLYPDGQGVQVNMPPAPYLLSWFSAGGKNDPSIWLPGNGTVSGQKWAPALWIMTMMPIPSWPQPDSNLEKACPSSLFSGGYLSNKRQNSSERSWPTT